MEIQQTLSVTFNDADLKQLVIDAIFKKTKLRVNESDIQFSFLEDEFFSARVQVATPQEEAPVKRATRGRPKKVIEPEATQSEDTTTPEDTPDSEDTGWVNVQEEDQVDDDADAHADDSTETEEESESEAKDEPEEKPAKTGLNFRKKGFNKSASSMNAMSSDTTPPTLFKFAKKK